MPITDEKSLKEWLEGRPREDAQVIANRAAQRVFPLWAWAMDRGWARERHFSALPILRHLLISGVGRVFPTDEVSTAIFAAARAEINASDRRSDFGIDPANDAASSVLLASSTFAVATPPHAVGSAVFSVNYAVNAAVNATIEVYKPTAYAESFAAVQSDASVIEQGKDPAAGLLWQSQAPDWFTIPEEKTRAIWAADPPGRWDFWIRWWDGILAGKPLDWDLQRDVALIPDADWQQGPDHIAQVIAGIEKARHPKPPSALESAVLRLALTDFTFNDLRTFLRMVPFESDLSVLRDPARLARFAEDAEDLRDALGDFATMAGVGETQTGKQVGGLLSRLSAELDRAGSVGTLRVGRLIDLGAQVQNACLNENIRIGLGDVLLPSLEIVTDRLLKLSRDYFPLALDRLEPLKQVRFLPEEDPAKIIAQLRRNLDGIRKVQDGKAVPLDPADIAVMSDVLEELERVNFAYQTTSDPAVRADLGNQLARKTAQTGVTFARYWIAARTAGDRAVKGLDWVIAWFKRYETVEKIIDALEPLWKGGSPPN